MTQFRTGLEHDQDWKGQLCLVDVEPIKRGALTGTRGVQDPAAAAFFSGNYRGDAASG